MFKQVNIFVIHKNFVPEFLLAAGNESASLKLFYALYERNTLWLNFFAQSDV